MAEKSEIRQLMDQWYNAQWELENAESLLEEAYDRGEGTPEERSEIRSEVLSGLYPLEPGDSGYNEAEE